MDLSIANALRLSADLNGGEYREAELLWLAHQARKHVRIVEVGAWLGATTRVLAENTTGTVYAVDTWDGGTCEYLRKRLARAETDWAYRQFCKNTANLSNVSSFRLASLLAARHFQAARATFDMIYIDASHDYESVKADILAWQPLLSPGGLLCGDDFSSETFGVRRAVQELLPGANQIAGSVWANIPIKYSVPGESVE